MANPAHTAEQAPTIAVRRAAVVTGRGPGAQTVGTRIVAPPPRGRFWRGLAFALLFITLVAGVSKISALRRTTEVVQHRDGSDPSSNSKAPGRTSRPCR